MEKIFSYLTSERESGNKNFTTENIPKGLVQIIF